MELEYEDHIVNIKYDFSSDHLKLDAYVHACDEALLLEAWLIREYQVAQRRIEITKLINVQIPIRTINLDKELNQQPILDDGEEHQGNPNGIMVDEQEIGNGVYRSIRNLLQIFIPIWNKSNPPTLQPGNTVYLKLGGDGRNVSHLQENGITINDVHWPIELFFSGDWKFMYNIIGLNAPNSKYFCLYCDCEASNRWNMDLHWTINKNTKSQKKPSLFPVIKEKNYIPDELHLLLRISDSRSSGGKWDWTSLMGPDKKKVLQYFPIVNFIPGKRGEDIQKLWHDFYDLYLVLRSPNLTNSEIDNFENKVKQWIKLFCRPSQGQINLSSQIPGKKFGIAVFFYFKYRKKNHNQVRLFFCGTTMGGGIRGKPVVHDIMEFENRQIYYLINNTPHEIQMRQIDAGDKEN
ncbi:hypothetical protein RhiirA4_482393 [Rhizophagus irregularis]|uniref:Uncharacterized protein n=1 Tax=Rhizophagus irregularis TaxID=588596 RepID=A0A2I1HL08_9GLOM|nr:hypothetical protein RhiirA4_482393 [Rhizophagus irregularis]